MACFLANLFCEFFLDNEHPCHKSLSDQIAITYFFVNAELKHLQSVDVLHLNRLLFQREKRQLKLDRDFYKAKKQCLAFPTLFVNDFASHSSLVLKQSAQKYRLQNNTYLEKISLLDFFENFLIAEEFQENLN